MTITKTITLYTFDELPTERAKEKARAWYREAGAHDEFVWENTLEDAKAIGLKIVALDPHRANEGSFIVSAIECSEKIFANHGADCETYKTAKAFDEANDALPELPAEDHPDYWKIERELCEGSDANESEFLRALLEDYRVMYERDIEYQNSDEAVDESMRCNEYTFTEDGKREEA